MNYLYQPTSPVLFEKPQHHGLSAANTCLEVSVGGQDVADRQPGRRTSTVGPTGGGNAWWNDESRGWKHGEIAVRYRKAHEDGCLLARKMEVSWNGGTPSSHPFEWHFPLEHIQLWGEPHGHGNLQMEAGAARKIRNMRNIHVHLWKEPFFGMRMGILMNHDGKEWYINIYIIIYI